MIKNLKKKAFTLVELLVVIAILAILATAGIVGYTSFTKKAQVSNDNSLVAELNNYISVASVTNDYNTVSEVRDELVNSGIDLSTLTPSAKNHGYSYAFNLKEEKFVLLNGTELAEGYSLANETKSWDVFVLVNSEAKANDYWNAGYSVYLQKGEYDGSLEAKAGVDVGENTNIATINYTNTAAAQNVVIRTNSYTTDVTVNTAGSVQHYGNVGKLKIDKVAMASFHEFGKVRTVEIKEGNFVVEPKAVVTLVSVTAEAAGQVKIAVQSQGTVEVVAGDSDKYEATTPLPAGTETVNAPIEDNTLAIVNGVAKTTLEAADFGDGKKVVLLKDYETSVTLGSCEVVGNLTKLNASITGEKTIVLKNVHTTKLSINEFTGSLTLDGGLLETNDVNAQNAAVHIKNGYGTYVFKNMVVAANTNKAIKISAAKSVTVDNCEFDATKLDSTVDVEGAFTARSLAAIDIQEQNDRYSTNGKMTIAIKDCKFKDIPQGSLTGGVADSDTAAAIKIKTEPTVGGAGFVSVAITGNTFSNCYRDVVVGVNVYSNLTTNGKKPADMRANAIDNKWTISGNKTTLTESVVSARGTLTYYNQSNLSLSEAERVGSIKGGCGVWETALSSHANDDQ